MTKTVCWDLRNIAANGSPPLQLLLVVFAGFCRVFGQYNRVKT